jgi:hypothetical protein
MDSSDFTAECWVYFISKTAYTVLVQKSGQSAISVSNWGIQLNATGTAFAFGAGQTSASGTGTWISTWPLLQSTTNPSTSTWYHVAISKQGTTYRLFVNTSRLHLCTF